MTNLPDDVVELAKASILADLRDRRFLKYLFNDCPDDCGAYGYVERPIDLETQNEIVGTIARAALEAARYGEMREALHKASGEIKVVRMHMLQRGRLWNALGDIEDALLSAIGEPNPDLGATQP